MLISEILLFEHFVNPITITEKEKYVDEVWDILQNSYAKIGGLKTNGLETKEGLVQNTVMWKLMIREGKIKIVFIYKDKAGRKKIATGTDGSREAKQELIKMLKAEFSRSYSEVSDDLERFLTKNLPEMVDRFKIPADDVSKIIIDDEIRPEPDGYHYQRKIGGHWHTKLMIGTPGKHITT